MIPDPSYPTQDQMARAMAQADMFVQQTRMQAQMQMAQSQTAFTGGIGGAQPGLMGYAGQALSGFGGGFMAQMQQQASAAVARAAMVPAAAAALGVPAFQQFGNVIEGARYAQPRMTLSGMVTAAFAPLSLFPQAGAAFNMEQRLVRQMAQEEIGRRTTQVGRAGVYETAAMGTMGISSYLMRRSGLEASWLGEMESERSAQRNLGYLRGGPYESATGFGVRREFFTRGAGRGYMRQLTEGAGALQRETGMNMQQIQLLTDVAQQSIDPTRGANFAAGGARGMQEMGREVSGIRRTMAQMSQSMQLAPEEVGQFFSKLRQVMEVSAQGIKSFQEENRRFSMGGPFSLRQVAEIRMQGMQMGRQMFMGGAETGNLAMQMAQDVATQRRTGIIRTDTLLREGGGLDQEAMARMMMQRLQRQAQAVQSGNFNIALTLAGSTPQAYTAMMSGGAGFFQTQASYAATMIRNPFALQQAWMDPNAMRQVTAQAPGIAFQQAQQLTALMPWKGQQQRVMAIEAFGRQMGMDVTNAQGFNDARVRYEEISDTRDRIEKGLNRLGYDRGADTPQGSFSQQALRRFGNTLLGFTQSTGASAEMAVEAMHTIRSNADSWREFSKASPARRSELLSEQGLRLRVGQIMAGGVSGQSEAYAALKNAPWFGSARSDAIIQGSQNAVVKLARENQMSNSEASRLLIGDLVDTRSIVSIKGASRDLYAPAAEAVAIPIFGGAVAAVHGGYRALTDSQFLKDEYEYKTESMQVNDAGVWEVQRETFDLNQKKLKSWLDRNWKGWRDKADVDLTKEMPAKIEEYVKKEGIKGIVTAEAVKPGTPEFAELERKLKATRDKRGAGAADEEMYMRATRFQDMLKGSPGVAAALATYGITPVRLRGGKYADEDKKSWEDMEKKIADLETTGAVTDERLRPLVAVSSLESKGTYNLQLTKLEGLDIGGMRKWFKHYAANEGAGVMAGKDVKKMSLKEMEEIATSKGFSDVDKKRLFGDLTQQAIERSQRLMQQTPLGEVGHPMQVNLSKESLEAMKAG